jgi:hypothetical protein
MMRVLAVVATIAVVFIAGLLGYDAWRAYQYREAAQYAQQLADAQERCLNEPNLKFRQASCQLAVNMIDGNVDRGGLSPWQVMIVLVAAVGVAAALAAPLLTRRRPHR